MEQTSRRGSVSVGALILIFIGILFLLQNFGILPWSVWGFLWRFWPLLLIIWGLQIIFGRTPTSRVAISIVAILLMLLVLAVTISAHHQPSRDWFGRNVPGLRLDKIGGVFSPIETSLTIAESKHAGVERRKLNADVGLGKLLIKDSSSTDYISLGSTHPENVGVPKLTDRKVGNDLEIDFDIDELAKMWPNLSGERSYILTFGRPSLVTDLDVNIGAGEGSIDLTQLTTRSVKVEIGAGKATIQLGAASVPTELIEASVGAGSANILLPESVGLEVEHKVGLGKIEVDGERLDNDGTFRSSNYDSAAVKLRIRVEVGTGSITINRQK